MNSHSISTKVIHTSSSQTKGRRVRRGREWEIVLQQTQIKKNQLKVFPNPASQTLFVEKNPDLEIKKIEILNTVVETLFVTTAEFNSIQIGWLSPGMYLLKAIDSEGKIWHSSFAKID
ncbi:MAG: T9SS type A sorting domain-containing protein [Bacteroidetes bacterium]|nr:T9SS type A sorting domain-containing protein [Bacteroidota bacterium]